MLKIRVFTGWISNRFLNKKYTICVDLVWIVIIKGYFLFEKQTFNGLLKVIGLLEHLNSFIFTYSVIHSKSNIIIT